MTHIFCTENAGPPIKGYSPEIIVHPILISKNDTKPEQYIKKRQESIEYIKTWVDALHGFTIGPGLGRDDYMCDYIPEIIKSIKKQIILLDADGIWYLSNGCKE